MAKFCSRTSGAVLLLILNLSINKFADSIIAVLFWRVTVAQLVRALVS